MRDWDVDGAGMLVARVWAQVWESLDPYCYYIINCQPRMYSKEVIIRSVRIVKVGTGLNRLIIKLGKDGIASIKVGKFWVKVFVQSNRNIFVLCFVDRFQWSCWCSWRLKWYVLRRQCVILDRSRCLRARAIIEMGRNGRCV